MKLLLLCTAMVLLLSVVELSRVKMQRKNSIAEMYRAANITEPIPESLLELCFKDVDVSFGMEIAPEQAIDKPVYKCDFEPGCYHTCLTISPDWPSSNNSFLSNSLLGIDVNMLYNNPNDKMPTYSFEVASWLGPSPPPGTGLHRYLAYCYKQKRRLDTTDKKLLSYEYVSTLFSIRKFAGIYDLISPPACGTMYEAQYPIVSQYPMKNNKNKYD